MSANTYKREPLWYKDAIFYELNIKGFCDSTGSGIGDFKGLISKLDYLEFLGVTTLWVLPFYPSPLRDDGYDIADYYNVNSIYGDVDDFRKFLDEAHKRNLKVITELVINHTSDQHEWFQRARNAPAGSVERDYYVWSDDPTKYKDVRIIFQDFETSNWTWDPVAKSYYWHRFYSHQPDLNYDNPAVQEEIFKIMDYWAAMGMDGFRLDAIPYLYEREGTNSENLPETHAFLKKLRKHMDDNYENVLFLAEANMWPEDSASYFSDGDECQMNFHFPLMPRMYMSLKMEERHPITDIFEQTPKIPDNCQWGMFLRNHDELTLEMVTDEERDYMRKYYAADHKARINLGIRRRLAPLLDNDRKRIELMNILLFSLPGTPVLYYGDEIGMGDNFYLGDRDGVRTPMQWNANQNAGFSEANPQSLYLPVIIDPEYDYKYVNVERQQRNTNSLLWWMKRTMATRQNYKEVFGRGEIEFLTPANSKVLAFLRTYQDQTILVVANLSRFVEGVYLDLSAYEGYSPVEIFGESTFQHIAKEPYFLSVAPHGYYWFLLKPVEMLAITDKMLKSPEISAASFNGLLQQKALTKQVLPAYFRRAAWFGNKDRAIEEVTLKEQIQLNDDYAILLVETTFRTGILELYQLPVTFKPLRLEDDAWRKEEVIGIARVGSQSGILLDAFHDEQFRLDFLNHAATLFNRKDLTVNFPSGLAVTDSTIRRATAQYVSIAYKEGYFVKFYRRVDEQPNPDYELNYWLTHKKVFPTSPALLGSLMFKKAGYHTSLAIIQPLIAHQGYGWDYVTDSVKRMIEKVLVNADKLTLAVNHISKFDTLTYETLPAFLQSVMDYSFVAKIQQLATRTAQMHLSLVNLSKNGDTSFEPELYSLHYQRSLYSSFKSLVRTVISALKDVMPNLDASQKTLAEQVIGVEKKILSDFNRIYVHKFEASKIRIHGNFHLEQVMMVGDDLMIDDFDGTYDRAFSERKLRKSPLVDVATMLRSIHYAASSVEKQHNDYAALTELLPVWYESVCSFFLQAYRQAIHTANIPEFIPDSTEDFSIMVEVFMLERALKELQYELNYRPDNLTIALKGILSLVSK